MSAASNLIQKVIEEKFNFIYKCGNNIMFGDDKMYNRDYEEIQEECRSRDESVKVSLKAIKEEVQVWCRNHTKEEKDKKSSIYNRLDEWAKGLELTDKGGIKESTKNIEYFLKNNPRYKDNIKYNEYLKRLEIFGKPIEDEDVAVIATDIEEILGFYNRSKLECVIQSFSKDVSITYHPVKDYFKSVMWDGKERLETMLTDWFDVEDKPLTREMSKKWMIAAVKRIMAPGCKFDNILMLQGAQGIGKSLFCERLAVGFGYTENPPIDQPKEYVPLLTSNWIIGIDERGALGKKDQNIVKSFITRTSDQVRLSYARRDGSFPRHCIFIGSTNDEKFLNDYSGMTEGRYWIVECRSSDRSKIYKEFTREVVDQLWAEAYYYYMNDKDIELIISSRLYQDFVEDQKKYKTYSDDEAYMMLEDRMSRGYTSNEFTDEEFFIETLTHPSQYVGINSLDKIPTRYIKMYLNSYHLGKSTSQVSLFMSELGYERKRCYYGGTRKTELCWVRRNSDLFEN